MNNSVARRMRELEAVSVDAILAGLATTQVSAFAIAGELAIEQAIKIPQIRRMAIIARYSPPAQRARYAPEPGARW